MSPRFRSQRLRATLLWFSLAAVTLLAGFAVAHLYLTLRSELATQSERAGEEARTHAHKALETLADSVRTETFSSLIAFHVDGLASSLRRWDEARPEILATFQWDNTRGLIVVSSQDGLSLPTSENVENLWPALRRWREQNLTVHEQPPRVVAQWQTQAHTTLNNPRHAGINLGYQDENIDLAAYAKQRVDPWCGWAAQLDQPRAPWIFWYQIGPDTPVRGCLLDPQPLLARCEALLADTTLAHLRLEQKPGLDALPGHTLVVAPGTLFSAKQTTAFLAAIAAALLLGLVLLAALMLARYSRRATLDAERKTTFVAQVSHELRTPLTSIQMFADMLAEPGLASEKRVKFVSNIARETTRLRALIERLLSFNALQQNKFQPTLETVDLAELIQETVAEAAPRLSDAGLVPVFQLHAAPALVCTDRSALKQALLNLLDNAAKYAARSGPLTVSLTATPTHHLLRVSDCGPGVPPALLPRLFEPFAQGGHSLTQKTSGLGLGLSLSRGLLREAGADLVFISTPSGAAFEIRLHL